MLYNRIITFIFLCILPELNFGNSLIINEVMFTNKTVLEDTDSDTPDWIELYNAGNEIINLANYSITDDRDKEDLWYFPAHELHPGEFFVIFASAKNKIIGNEFHTDFKLRTLEESVFLLNPNREVIDFTIAQCVPPDKSLACISDGISNQRKILSPTPGYSNNEAQVFDINYQRDTLMANLLGGFFSQNIEINLLNEVAQNQIYYSLNADDPDTDEILYDEVIQLSDLTNNEIRFADIPPTDFEIGDQITKTPIIRAQVYSEGCPASNEISQAYFIGQELSEKYNVYVVSMITDKDNLFDEDEGIYVYGNHQNYLRRGKKWERPVSIEIYNPEGEKIINQKAGIRIHGRGSRMRPQKSFRLYAREEYGPPFFNYAFFNQKPHLSKFKRLLLRSAKDWGESIIKDDLTQELVSTMNVDYTASETAVLFINGEYWGIYSLRERQDEYYVADNYKTEVTDLNVISYLRGGVVADEGTINNYESMISWLEMADTESESFYEEANSRIDLNALIDYYIAEIYLANTDFPENNLRLWKTECDTSRWRYFFYDCDACMVRGSEDHLSDYTNEMDDFQDYNSYATFVLGKMLQNEQFNEAFRLKNLHHINNTFNADRVISKIDLFESRFASLIPEHTYRWHTPSDFNKWQMNVDGLRDFALLRPNEMKTQIIEQLGIPFEVYPNPTQGFFKIEAGWGNEQYRMSVYNVLGKLIFQKMYDSINPIQVNKNLASGTYIVRLESEGLAFTRKLIVQ